MTTSALSRHHACEKLYERMTAPLMNFLWGVHQAGQLEVTEWNQGRPQNEESPQYVPVSPIMVVKAGLNKDDVFEIALSCIDDPEIRAFVRYYPATGEIDYLVSIPVTPNPWGAVRLPTHLYFDALVYFTSQIELQTGKQATA